MTTKGDLVAGTAADAAARVAAGANGSFLFADSGADSGVSSSLISRFMATGADSGYITGATWEHSFEGTPLWGAEAFDTAGAYNYTTEHFIVPHAGLYLIALHTAMMTAGTPPAGAIYKYAVYVNSVLYSVVAAGVVQYSTSVTIQPFLGMDLLSLKKGDQVDIYISATNNGYRPYTYDAYNRWAMTALVTF